MILGSRDERIRPNVGLVMTGEGPYGDA